MSGLESKNVVITGAASGIGEASALAFSRAGARVLIADIDAAKGDAVANKIRSNGGEAHFVYCDVTAFDDVGTAVNAAVDRWGSIDVLMNNAGIGPAGDSILELEPEQFDTIINTNLRSVFFGMKHAVPAMRAQGGGAIVSTASVGALPGIVGGLAYGASKAGIVRMTMEVAALHGGDGIRVNAILPGMTMTPMSIARTPGMSDDERAQMFASLQPIPRVLSPRDIAQAAVWLASDEASFVTGQALTVDGGMVMAGWGNRVNAKTT